MNSRIKELCEHSKAYATECTKHFTGNEPVVWMDYYTEKFAELIVKECDMVLSEDDGATHHSELLFTYFGVEE